jgi:hypothetical protein
MTDDKKFKARVRARMDATGESYAQARAALEPQRPKLASVDTRMLPREPDAHELEELRQLATTQLEEGRREGVGQRRRRLEMWPHTPTGDLDPDAAMTRLASLFPSLRDAAGVKPWNVEAFVTWTCGPAPGGGAIEAARFVLQVWSSDVDWTEFAREVGIEGGSALAPFNVVRAMGRWDRDHAEAMLAWLRAPFYP